jgi:hypothetical protein
LQAAEGAGHILVKGAAEEGLKHVLLEVVVGLKPQVDYPGYLYLDMI